MSPKLPESLPPFEPPLHISGPVEHLHLSYGTNAQSASTTSSADTLVASSQNSFYTKHLSKHGPAYWFIHFFIALAATALFEFGLWLYHSFR